MALDDCHHHAIRTARRSEMSLTAFLREPNHYSAQLLLPFFTTNDHLRLSETSQALQVMRSCLSRLKLVNSPSALLLPEVVVEAGVGRLLAHQQQLDYLTFDCSKARHLLPVLERMASMGIGCQVKRLDVWQKESLCNTSYSALREDIQVVPHVLSRDGLRGLQS